MTLLLQLFITFLLPALLGALVGFPSGVITALYWVCRQREQGETVPTYTDDTNPTPGRVPWKGREHLSRMGWMLAVLGIIGFLAGIVGLVQNNNTAGCLRSYITQSSVINQQRAAAGDADRQGIRQVRQVNQEFYQLIIASVTNPATDPAQREQARQDFLVKANDWDARLAEVDRLDREAEQRRQDNPLPPEPNC